MSAAEHYRQIARDVLAYGVLAAVSRASSIILLPLLTRYFSVEDYGLIDLFAVSVSLFAIFIRMAMPSAINRYYHASGGGVSRPRLLGTCLIMVGAVGATCNALAWIGYRWLPLEWLPVELSIEIVSLGFGTAALLALSSLPEAVLRARREILRSNLVNFINTAVYLGLTLWWIMAADADLPRVFAAQLAGAASACGIGVWFIRREVEWRFAGDAARSVLRFGLPLVPAIMVTWANEQADRLILLWLSGLGGVAIYGAAAKTALIFHFAASMFRHAWRPYSMTLLEADDRNAIYRSVLRVYMAGFAIVGLAFTAAAPELFSLLVPQAYARGVACIPWLVGTALLYQSISITNLGLIVSRRTSEISRIAALAVLLNVAISIPLILAVGIEGAAIGAFIAVAALSALLLHGSNRAAGLAFQWRSLLGPTGVFLAGSLLTNELSQIEPLWSSALARITIVLFGSALIYRCFIDGDARSALASLVTVRTPAAS